MGNNINMKEENLSRGGVDQAYCSAPKETKICNTKNPADSIIQLSLCVKHKQLEEYMNAVAKIKCPFEIIIEDSVPDVLYENKKDIPGIEDIVRVVTGFAPDNSYISRIPLMRINKDFVEDISQDPALLAAGMTSTSINLEKCANAFTTKLAEDRGNGVIDVYLKTTTLITKAALWASSSPVVFEDMITGKFSVNIQHNGVDGYIVVLSNAKYENNK